MFDTDNQGYIWLLVITNTGATPPTRYYSDKPPNGRIDGKLATPELTLNSSISKKAPFILDNNFPEKFISFSVPASDDNLDYFNNKDMKNGTVKLYLLPEDAITLSGYSSLFSGVVCSPNGITTNKKTGETPTINVNCTNFQPALSLIIPEQTIPISQDELVQGERVKEIISKTFPIIAGRYVLSESSDWSNKFFNGEIDDVIKMYHAINPVARIDYVNYKLPKYMGRLNTTLCNLNYYKIQNTDSSNKTAFYCNTFEKHDLGKWEKNYYEGFAERDAGTAGEFPEKYLYEVGLFHKVKWAFYEDLLSNSDIDVLCIGREIGLDKAIDYGLSPYLLPGFWICWQDEDDNQLKAKLIDRGTINTTKIFTTNIYYSKKVWKRAFGFRYDSPAFEYNWGTFVVKDPAGSPILYLVTFSHPATATFTFIASINISSTADLSWADGDWDSAGLNITALCVFDCSVCYVFDRTTGGSLNAVSDTSSYLSGANSSKGVFCFRYRSAGNSVSVYNRCWKYQERLRYVATRTGTRIRLIRIDKSLTYYFTSVHNFTVSGDITEIAGAMIEGDTVTAVGTAYYFLNTTDDDITKVYSYASTVTNSRALPFGKIYDIWALPVSRDENYIFFATNNGVFWCDCYLVFSNISTDGSTSGTGLFFSSLTDSEWGLYFHKASDRIINTLALYRGVDHYGNEQYIKDNTEPEDKLRRLFWEKYIFGLKRIDNDINNKYVSGESGDGSLYCTTQFNSIEDLGWEGKAEFNINEMTDGEKLAGYLLWKANGGADYSYWTGLSSDLINLSNWNTEIAKRKVFLEGGFRLEIFNQGKAINQALYILKQLNQIPYMHNGQLKLKYLFQNQSTPAFIIYAEDVLEITTMELETYITEVIIKFNKLRGDTFSFNSNAVPSAYIYGLAQQYSFIYDLIYKYNDGLGVSNTFYSYQTVLKLLQCWLTNYNPATNTNGDPLRVIQATLKPRAHNIELTSRVDVNSDVGDENGVYWIFEHEVTNDNPPRVNVVLIEEPSYTFTATP